jgi:Sap, sulfolipid-1-addressing protein
VGSLLAIVLPLALGAAISPTLFALEILVLSGRRHPVARAWALAGGAAATLIAFSVLGLTLLQNLHSGRHNHSPADASIDLVAGILLALLAARALHPRKTAAESHHDRTQSRLADTPTILFAGVGGLGMLVNFSTLLLFLPALHEISRSSVSLPGKEITWLILTVITLLPVLIPVTLVVILGHRASPLLDRLNAFVGSHSRQITVTIEVLFAVVLIWKGIGELT